MGGRGPIITPGADLGRPDKHSLRSSAMVLISHHPRLDAAYQTAHAALLAERTPDGHWVGELSASALSTAVAVSALAQVQKKGSGVFSAEKTPDPFLNGGL